MKISGNIVDVLKKEICPGTVRISKGKICEIKKEGNPYSTYILPGFIDSHIHIESSMLTPAEFARAAVVHGTVAVVSDPHEIANVLGMKGIKFMVNNSKEVSFKFYFGAPSCVPATDMETSGSKIGPNEVEKLMRMKEIKFLSEVMNFPGVINNDPETMKKIEIARKHGKPVDGHAPGLIGKELKKYAGAGISTDHECFSMKEALEKIKIGMMVQIREGSAAKNFDELAGLMDRYPDKCMLCSDDKHPDDLVKGHINEMVKRAVKKKINLFNILKAACLNPVIHYKLDVGLLRKGDPADFIVVDNLKNFNILCTCINGKMVAKKGKTLLKRKMVKAINKFKSREKKIQEFLIKPREGRINVIEAQDGQLITRRKLEEPKVSYGKVVSDPSRDILKIAVVNRYKDSKPSVGFVKNFGLKRGAIASSVSHDSHNVIGVGTDDRELCRAINLIIRSRGGICAVSGNMKKVLPLPIGGIISKLSFDKVSQKYEEIDRLAKKLGSELKSPFMTLSFMALPVIPEIKITDKGLFDVNRFKFIDLFEKT